MPSVLVTRRLPSSILNKLRAATTIVDIYAGEGAMPRDELRSRISDKDALICVLTDQIDAEILDAAPKLNSALPIVQLVLAI